jgi:ribosomal-protein-alanine N-acetyltransferase
MNVETVRSERLELVWLSPQLIEALLEGRPEEAARIGGFAIPVGFPDEHDRRFLALRLRQTEHDPSRAPWYVRAIVLAQDDRPMIGHIGFHGPPGVNARRDPDAVELGYTIFPEHRRRGYATEAVRALIAAAETQGVRRFVASVGPENEPSLAIVRRLGFVEVGRHWDDEDGEELEFELSSDGRGDEAGTVSRANGDAP